MSIHMEFAYPEEVERAKREVWPILIPIGTMEYHSTHCPFGCDTLVSMGFAEKIGEKIDALILPPIWYGVASYAVAGPEKNTIHVDCDTLEIYVYSILKSLFKGGLNKNIYILIAHQTEDYMPMTLACMKAAKKLTMEYLEDQDGYGWWGKNDNKDFYENLKGRDNPWNWVRVLRLPSRAVDKEFGADHAGKYECSLLESFYPGSIKLERLVHSEDWFAESAKDMSVEMGMKMIDLAVDEIVAMMRGESDG